MSIIEEMISVVPNKHQQKTEATKKRLLKSAVRVFAKKGVQAASIDDIARDAGYTRGAFYANFKSKEDLFFALIEQRTAEDLVALRSKVSQTTNDRQKIELLRDFYASRIRAREWGLLMLEFKLYVARNGKMRLKLAERFKALRDHIRLQYVAELGPSSVAELCKSSGEKMVVLGAILDGLTLRRAYEPGLLSDEAAEEILCDLFDTVMSPMMGALERDASEIA